MRQRENGNTGSRNNMDDAVTGRFGDGYTGDSDHLSLSSRFPWHRRYAYIASRRHGNERHNFATSASIFGNSRNTMGLQSLPLLRLLPDVHQNSPGFRPAVRRCSLEHSVAPPHQTFATRVFVCNKSDHLCHLGDLSNRGLSAIYHIKELF